MKLDPIAFSNWELSLVIKAGPHPRDPDEQLERKRDYAADETYRTEFRRFMGLPERSDPWHSVQLTPATIVRLLEWIEPMERHASAHFAGGYLTETAIVDHPEWYILNPRHDDKPIERAEDGVECVGRYWHRVSDVFLRSVQLHRLTGVRFIQEPDESRFRKRRQWFEPIPTIAMGRGADHPWVDREVRRREGSDVERETKWLHGIRHFYNNQLLLSPPGLSDPFKQLIAHFPPEELTIHGAVRLPRHHLPESDFAMLLHFGNQDSLCIRANAVELLQQDGVLSSYDCERIVVLDELDPDPDYDLPVDLNSIAGMENSLQQKDVITVQDASSPKWVYEWTPATALEAAKREFDASREKSPIDEAELQAAIEELGMPVPQLWRELMLSVQQWQTIGECFIPTPNLWLERQEYEEDTLNGAARVPGCRYLYVGSNSTGDSFALELPATGSEPMVDAPLLFLDHEISRFTQRWPSITRYIEEWLRTE